MSRRRYVIVDEQRHATRFERDRGTDVAVLWTQGGDEQLVDVHDESLGGLGLYLKNVDDLQIGTQVNIVYLDQFLNATVRHIEPHEDGGYVVGFACERILE